MRRIADIRKPEMLEALYETIKEEGANLPGYDRIATRSEASRQLIRHYFPNSEALALGMCDFLAALYRDRLTRHVAEVESKDRLNTFLDFYFGMMSGDTAKPEDDQVYDAMMAFAAGSEAVRRNLRDQYGLLQMTVAHEIQVTHAAMPQAACRELAFLMVSLMYGHWKMVASLGFDEAYNRVSREAMDRLIASYAERYEDPDA